MAHPKNPDLRNREIIFSSADSECLSDIQAMYKDLAYTRVSNSEVVRRALRVLHERMKKIERKASDLGTVDRAAREVVNEIIAISEVRVR